MEEETKAILFLADTHYNYDLNPEESMGKVRNISEEHSCEEVWLAGDVGEPRDLRRMVDYLDTPMKVVKGNHDAWRKGTIEEIFQHGEGEYFSDEFAGKIEVGDMNYETTMAHKLDNYGIGMIHAIDRKSGIDEEYQGKDIILTGHTHIPYASILKEGPLFFNPGSTISNNAENVPRWVPKRTVSVLGMNHVVDYKLIDFDNLNVVKENIYRKGENGFDKLSEWSRWGSKPDIKINFS